MDFCKTLLPTNPAITIFSFKGGVGMLNRRSNGKSALQMVRKDMERDSQLHRQRMDELRALRRMGVENDKLRRVLERKNNMELKRKRMGGTKKDKERMDRREDFIQFLEEKQSSPEQEGGEDQEDFSVGD